MSQLSGIINRLSDPVTSWDSAKKTSESLKGRRRQFVDGLIACGGSATANEAASAITDNYSLRESIRKRAAECLDRGYVHLAGTRECKVTGNNCQVYEVAK